MICVKTINQAFKLFLILSILTGIVYPLLITLFGQMLFPDKVSGSLIKKGERFVGSELIGQKFCSDIYFWPRPSATDYNPLPSCGSNLGPTNAGLKELVISRRATLEKANPGTGDIPPDLVFASGSGLDPDISPEAARFQINRVAIARGLDNNSKIKLINLIEQEIEQPDFGIFGKPRINVVRLNLALDSMFTGGNQ